MNTINNPPSRVYYLATEAGVVQHYGYVDPGQRLDSPAEGFETFANLDALNARLAALGHIEEGAEPSPNDSVEAARIILTAKVNFIRAQKLALPVNYMGHTFDSDAVAVQNITGLVAVIGVGVNLGASIGYRGADNVTVDMTAAQLVGLAGTMLAYRSACYTKSWALKQAIADASDPRTVDILNGWPTP